MITDIVILAGGTGERLWPASTSMHPKQFFLLSDNLTFFQASLLRSLSLEISGKIIVVTRKELVEECTSQCRQLCQNLASKSAAKKLQQDTIIIGEPCQRHTLAALLTAISLIRKLKPGENHTILTVTSDHVMENTIAFLKDAEIAAAAAENGNLVVFGIKPVRATTEYGYIKRSKEQDRNGVSKVRRFLQKPDLQRAQAFVKNPDYLWNSGMLCFTASFFLAQTRHNASKVYQSFKAIKDSAAPVIALRNNFRTVVRWDVLDSIYPDLPRLDADKVITEHTKNSYVVEAHFSWADIGTWDSFSSAIQLKQTEKVVQVKSEGNMVYTDIPVVLCGVDDLIIVQKEGKLLVMKKEQSALLKSAVEQFNSSTEDRN